MKAHVVSFLSGLVFAFGLAIGGMLQPARVVGFLDFFGTWDPTLAFVMAGGLSVNLFAYHILTKKRDAPAFSPEFHLPTRKDVDAPLVVGAGIFGAGWALAGYCPGPAVTSLALGTFDALAFVAAMAAGIYAFSVFERPGAHVAKVG